jgi:protein gp37
MGSTTGIEWTDSTWSPIRFRVKQDAAAIAQAKGYTSLVSIAERMAGHVGPHCEHVSPGCENCYAETNNHRCLPANGTGLPYDRRSRDLVEPFVDERILLQPLGWRSIPHHERTGIKTRGACECPSTPRRIFVENQSDLFGEWVTDDMLDQSFAMMALCPQHDFQVLTKRSERMRVYFSGAPWGCIEERAREIVKAHPKLFPQWPQGFGTILHIPLRNVWLGVTAENQKQADQRIPDLMVTPAAVRFLSCEPLLGEIDLWTFLYTGVGSARFNRLHWVICGGESGPHARVMHPHWARSLRDQCQRAEIPFFFKQHGEWISLADYDMFKHGRDTDKYLHQFAWRTGVMNDSELPISCYRVGKKSSGSLLDGREWKEFSCQK